MKVQPPSRHPIRQLASFAVAVLVIVPGVLLRLGAFTPPPPIQSLLLGLAIVGAAFILAWAAEAVQVDVSAGLAIAILAFITVLPEYAVDLVFAWKGGNAFQLHGEACKAADAVGASPCSLALANMTGANRLLIGIGWPLVFFIAWFRYRRTRGRPLHEVVLGRSHSIELSFLAVATAYSLTLPLRSSLTLVDAAVLIAVFVGYTVRVSGVPPGEPHLLGPARYIGGLGAVRRRTAVGVMFLFSATVILLCAERFADALVHTGEQLGISQFLLVQWLAPLASEAPELVVASIYAWGMNSDASLGTLVSSKVNQWTLLVGTLPIVFALASGSLHGLPMEPMQREEVLLTAAQSFFAVATLVTLSLSTWEAAGLLGLFLIQFLLGAVVPPWALGWERIIVAVVYLILGVAVLFRHRRHLPRLLRDGFRTSHGELGADDRLRA